MTDFVHMVEAFIWGGCLTALAGRRYLLRWVRECQQAQSEAVAARQRYEQQSAGWPGEAWTFHDDLNPER